MTDVKNSLPLTSVVEPATQEQVVDHLRTCYESAKATYPIGGGTSLDYGQPGRVPGIGLQMTGLNRIVDYPARDMTITVEAGITMASLSAELARQGQRLPIDATDAERATLGGMIATNFSGPRRYGYGTLRDYVIGIGAIDGRGTPFKAGGRVVKNVAGYDLCKLLTGSLGTLAVITQVTLKVRPMPEATAFLGCYPSSWQHAEALLAALVTSRTTPVAIELSAGAAVGRAPRGAAFPGRLGQTTTASEGRPTKAEHPLHRDFEQPLGGVARLLVGFEGSFLEVGWQIEQLRREWSESGVDPAAVDHHTQELATSLWQTLSEVPRAAPLVIKANVRPSAVTSFVQIVLELDPEASIEAHAGNGVVIAAFSDFSPADAGRILVQRLQPAAVAAGGNVVVWSCAAGELTRQATWGAAPGGADLMRAVKHQFDPKGLLNPGRFLYGVA
jgi:glycolate oxidase FAD binding subunit